MNNSKDYNRSYYVGHREERRERHNKVSLEYHHSHREKINEVRRRPENRKKETIYHKESSKKYRENLRIEVLTYYGQGKLVCVTCGEDRLPSLTIDHINNNGAEHRRQIGSNICLWLKKQGYPEGYQTLCWNCQWMKRSIEAKEGA